MTGARAVELKPVKINSERLRADICLGVAIAGVETLVAIGLFISFSWRTALWWVFSASPGSRGRLCPQSPPPRSKLSVSLLPHRTFSRF